MRRLGILVTFNNGRVHPYIKYIAKSICECCNSLYIVCNYEYDERAREEFGAYTQFVHFRENEGWDSGAYRDIMCNIIGWNEVCSYEEIVLLNDSFFGPFYRFEKLFSMMESVDSDYWGITEHGHGYFINPYTEFPRHIQSYFLVFRKNVIESDVFRIFWEHLENPKSPREAVLNFEIELNKRLHSAGFISASLLCNEGYAIKENENAYWLYPCDLVTKYKIPILKRKALLLYREGFKQVIELIKYLDVNSDYNISWITEELELQFYNPSVSNEITNSLYEFVQHFSMIYIYGMGICGNNLKEYFEYRHIKGFKGFIVSDASENSEYSIKRVVANKDTAIIISVANSKVSDEIRNTIGDMVPDNQIFRIADCPAIRVDE